MFKLSGEYVQMCLGKVFIAKIEVIKANLPIHKTRLKLDHIYGS